MNRTFAKPFLSRLRASRLPATLCLLVMLAPLVPRPAFADSGGVSPPAPGGQAGIYDTSACESLGGGKAGHSAVSVNPTTGTANAAVPFELPDARGRSQPHLG